jgi:ribosomal protein L37AE/L43A
MGKSYLQTCANVCWSCRSCGDDILGRLWQFSASTEEFANSEVGTMDGSR